MLTSSDRDVVLDKHRLAPQHVLAVHEHVTDRR